MNWHNCEEVSYPTKTQTKSLKLFSQPLRQIESNFVNICCTCFFSHTIPCNCVEDNSLFFTVFMTPINRVIPWDNSTPLSSYCSGNSQDSNWICSFVNQLQKSWWWKFLRIIEHGSRAGEAVFAWRCRGTNWAMDYYILLSLRNKSDKLQAYVLHLCKYRNACGLTGFLKQTAFRFRLFTCAYWRGESHNEEISWSLSLHQQTVAQQYNII